MSVATSGRDHRFRYEVDLVAALEPGFADSVFRANDATVHTFREVPAVRGVPDLTAVRFNPEALRARVESGVRPLTTDVEVRAVIALRRRRLSIADLANHLGLSRDYTRRTVVPLLDDLGWVAPVDGLFALREGAVPVGRRVVTVEAKLKDWIRALDQARHQQFSADAAYIALDAANARGALEQLSAISERGVGVIVVDATTRRHMIAARPRKTLNSERTRVGRFLIAERCFELFLRGERAGQVAPVFGWFPPGKREL